jgi:peptide-methionine (R)-S-oxide reductase
MEDKDFKTKLTPEQYKVLREKHTEASGTGKLLHNKKTGMYKCAACGNILFSSEHKFDSGTGWPSFYELAKNKAVKLEEDSSLGMTRTEVLCAKCGSHLGHVFNETKTEKCPTGKRYCINSLALDFKEK